MRPSFKNIGLLSCGVLAGLLISLGITAVAQREAETPLPLEELQQFSAVFGAIKENYVEPVEDKKLITEAISGMLNGLDPHSAYLDAESYKELQVGTQGEFGGLGIEIGAEEGFVKVISPIEDTPAARAGIKAGDLIIKINEKSTKGLSLNDAVKLMRGKPNTNITLTLARKGEPRVIVVTLTRAIIKVRSVRSKIIEPGYAFVRITQFQEQTAQDLVNHLTKLDTETPLKGIVLDLRNDPGGLLYGAVGVSATFLPARTKVVSTDGRTEDSKRQYFAIPEHYAIRGAKHNFMAKLPAHIKTVPLVVLVNAGSASASEIVAGALQDNRRATIMGTQTFGKGSVQTVLPLSATTAIKLTTARYYTPNGRSIQAKGITPDLLVEETPEGDLPGFRLHEADLDKHLENSKGALVKTKKPQDHKESRSGNKDETKRKPLEFGSADDYQLQQALNSLKGLPVAVVKPDTTPVNAEVDPTTLFQNKSTTQEKPSKSK